jgi:metallo-beta-lactamase class B
MKMKYSGLLLLCLAAFCLQINAQFSVRFVVSDVATKKNDDIYLAGTFNNWNPKDEKFKLKPFAGGRKSIVLKDVPVGNYAFKFTRGSFDKVECMADGRDISDRLVEVNTDISQEIIIAGWKDDYPERPKRYTASPQVKIIDTAFDIPQLNRKRRIWIYLPKGYSASTKTYPVLYMQDGQNLFNEQTAGSAGEWGIDECLDTLCKQLNKDCIVVGIDHGGDKRLSEYSPYNFTIKGNLAPPDQIGEGKQYAEFIVKTLKPFIDTKYRTKKGRVNTFIAGSSMGGIISEYALINYPETFGAAGIFSPAYWIVPNLFLEADQFDAKELPRFYLYAGGKESNTMVSDLDKMYDILAKKKRGDLNRTINPLGEHKEKYWQQAFPAFFAWLMNME